MKRDMWMKGSRSGINRLAIEKSPLGKEGSLK